MFNDPQPRQFLGYSASDQRTVRELVAHYDGILVPGTIATFQREGTAGFVLTLSARGPSQPYVIDPRFPLFQQDLPTTKVSHSALADILGDPDLICTTAPSHHDFGPERIGRIASAWIDFNLSYREQQSAKFAKYAERLGESLDLTDARGPERVLAPYFCVDGRSDPWWQRSLAFYAATREAARGRIEVTQVLAAKSSDALMDLANESGSQNVCVWVSGLNELTASSNQLAAYGGAIRNIRKSNRRSFALYGGFFAVALSAIGLWGASHGIGYGEYRRWRELPQRGPPPSRYYLPTIHRYAQRDDAYQLWLHDPGLVSESTVVRPITLQYHELKLHSVMARAQEIENYRSLDLPSTIDRLEADLLEFQGRLNAGSPSYLVRRIGERLTDHMPRWLTALRML